MPRESDAIVDLDNIFIGLLKLVGITVDGASERTQGIAIFGAIGLFGLIGGFCLTGWASIALFSIAGLCLLALVLILCGIAD